MLIRFWGTRGSLPAPISGAAVEAKIRHALMRSLSRKLVTGDDVDQFMQEGLTFAERSHYGGNSSCVQVDIAEGEYVICDFGTGIRDFGNHMMTIHGPTKPQTYNVFMSHLHWDHMMGFPFFVPAYVKGNRIRIHGCHPDMRKAFETQHSLPGFPVPFKALGATIEFVDLEPDRDYKIGGMTVRAMAQVHAGGSFGYRFESAGKVFVYSTDSEHPLDQEGVRERFVDLFRGADLIVFDAMYSFAEAVDFKQGWGHSSNIEGIDLALAAGAKRLALFHHDPNSTDANLDGILKESRRYEDITRTHASGDKSELEVLAAYDGLEIFL
jgi:phosphoribosyl 1,2-cyclic phosphodiesterase